MMLLLLQLIFFMFALALSGEPLRIVFLRKRTLFSDLDFLQILILDIYLGGAILYLFAIFPVGLFNKVIVFAIPLFGFVFSFFVHSKAIGQLTKLDKVKTFLTEKKWMIFDCLFVFAMVALFLFIDLSSSSTLVFGSAFDESAHSLKVEVILENGHIPLTLQPYVGEGIIYPQGSHVIFAFAYYILNIEVPKAVFYITIFFKALSVLGAYFLGKKLSSSRTYYLGLSFIFTFISSWPLFVSWGGNPFLVGFPLFLVNLGLFFSLLRTQGKSNFAELVALGLLFGYGGALIISYLQTLIVIALFVVVFWLIQKHCLIRRKFLECLLIISVSLLPLSPFLFRFFAFYGYPGHNIGVPTDFVSYPQQQFIVAQALTWAFENLSPHFLLRLLMLFIIGGLAILLWKTKNYKDVKPTVAFAGAIFLSANILSFISFFLSRDFEIISWGHQGIILMISVNILIAVFYFKLLKFLQNCSLTKLFKAFSKNLLITFLLAVTLLASTTIPFLYYRATEDCAILNSSYRSFAVTTQDDYALIEWMKENVSSNSVILVSPYEPGLFIPSVSHHRIVFPYSASGFTRSYQTLINLIQNNVLNETAYDLMFNLSISHVYVGSDAAYWWFERYKWNPTLFLGNPNFRLVKNFGNSYLFQLEYTHPNVVFSDDFEHTLWNENGWHVGTDGNGVGNTNTTTDSDHDGAKSLRITAKAVYTPSEWKYANKISREVFVSNNSDVTLSFCLNATEGFNNKPPLNDTFAVFISNIYRNQSLVFTTPNGVYENYACTVQLTSHEGNFTCDLSTKWQQMFDAFLPNSFILEFVNYDFDGVENVAYIDNVEVTSVPLT